jgi:hypothetical protein
MTNINIGIANLYVTKKLKDSYFNNLLLEESKKVNTEFSDVLNNSPILQLEYKVFNNLESKHIDNDLAASRYIDNNIKLFEVYTLKEIETEHNKLLKFVNKSIINEKKYNLYVNIQKLITESLSDYENIDVDVIHESFTYVLNHIKEEKETINNNLLNENVINLAISKYNKKYEFLTENDKILLKKILKSSIIEKENLFNNLKQENILLLENVNKTDISSSTENKISTTISKLNELNFNKNSIDKDIIELYELKKELIKE